MKVKPTIAKSLESLIGINVKASMDIGSTSYDFLDKQRLSDILISKSSREGRTFSFKTDFLKQKAEEFVQGIDDTIVDSFDRDFLNKCLNIAYFAHQDENRKIGYTYFIHPITAAMEANLSDYMGYASTILHDVPEFYTMEDYVMHEKEFDQLICEKLPQIYMNLSKGGEFDPDFINAFSTELFRSEKLTGKKNYNLSTFQGIQQAWTELKSQDRKKPTEPLEEIEDHSRKIRLEQEFHDASHKALQTILRNKIMAALREQYLQKLDEKLGYFVRKYAPEGELQARNRELDLLINPMVSNLSRFKGLTQTYYHYLNEIAPYYTVGADGKHIIRPGAIPNRHYLTLGLWEMDKPRFEAYVKAGIAKLADAVSNLNEIWAPEHHTDTVVIEKSNEEFRDLYYGNRENYTELRKNITKAYQNLPAGEKNQIPGENRLKTIAKALIALNIMREHRLYLKDNGIEHGLLDKQEAVENNLAIAIAEHAHHEAEHIKYYYSEVDVTFEDQARRDLKKYEDMGLLDKITDPYKGQAETPGTGYRRFDGMMQKFFNIILHDEMTIKSFVEDRKTQFLAALAFERIGQKYVGQEHYPNYHMRGFERLLPEPLRPTYHLEPELPSIGGESSNGTK